MGIRVLKTIRFFSAAAHVSGLMALATGTATLLLLPVMAWSCLFFLAADNQVRESNSVFLAGRKRAAEILAASVLFGAFLESANFLLGHHYYAGFPSEAWIRWPLFTAVFAVVIPLILEIERKLENLGLADVLTWRRIRVTRGLAWGLILLGALLAVLLAIAPAVLYPLLLVAFLLLFDPLVLLTGPEGRSLIGQFEEAYYGQAFRLIFAGLLFGFFWEFWNFRAGAKWFYAPPAFEQAFLFELPILEFWGYAFTSLSGYAFYQLCLVFRDRMAGNLGSNTSLILAAVILVMALAAVLAGMDVMTTVSFRQVL